MAIGQIVNRRFDAVRYIPTAWMSVSSPTHSPALCAAVKAGWGATTPAAHRASLIRDCLMPDHEYRRIGACKRLAYYYPDALESLALKLLAQPTYSVPDAEAFVRGQLYPETDLQKRRVLFDAFIAKHGAAARDGILVQLFSDLELQEANEEKRLHYALKEFTDQPRKLLIELYGKPKSVRHSDRPYVDAMSQHERTTFIQSLLYDQSPAVDKAVHGILKGAEGDEALALACMKRLVGRGFDPDIERYCKRRLQTATDQERETWQALLDKRGWTRLHVAIEQRYSERIHALLAQRIDVNARAVNGLTALHLAAAWGDLEIVKSLVAHQAALDPLNDRGLTAAQVASRAGHDPVVTFLAARGCQVPDLLVAATVGRADRVDDLFRKGASPDDPKDTGGRTPLHLAALRGHATVVSSLLNKGAGVNRTNDQGWTPLHEAAATGNTAVARVLLHHHADIRARLPEEGFEPLHVAAYCGRLGVARLLVACHADINARDTQSGSTPLHWAAQQGHTQLVAWLLARKATVAIENDNGETPLALARKQGHGAIVKLLSEHGAVK